MSIFDKMFGPKSEEIKKPGEQEEVLPPFEDDGSDTSDGDPLPETESTLHNPEGVLGEDVELRSKSAKEKEGIK